MTTIPQHATLDRLARKYGRLQVHEYRRGHIRVTTPGGIRIWINVHGVETRRLSGGPRPKFH